MRERDSTEMLNELREAVERFFESRQTRDPRSDADAVIAVISACLGGRQLYLPRHSLPRALRHTQIVQEHAGGASVEQLARRYRLTPRRVQQIIKHHKENR